MAKISAGEINSVRLKAQGSNPTTPASGYGQLYIKADGLYFINDAGVVVGPLASSGTTPGMAKIAEQILGADTASITFSSIPGTYRHLKLLVTGRTTEVTTIAAFLAQFNDDAGSNYANQNIYGNGTTPTASQANSQAKARCGWLAGASSGASYPGGSEITIFDYARTAWYKAGSGISSQWSALTAGGGFAVHDAFVWASTAAITKIVLTPNGGNFKAGTVATLYGVL